MPMPTSPALASIGMGVAGATGNFGLGTDLQNQVTAETDEERRRRMAQQQQQRTLGPAAQSVLEANLRRLSRSAVKRRRIDRLPIEEADLLAIESTARELITLAQ